MKQHLLVLVGLSAAMALAIPPAGAQTNAPAAAGQPAPSQKPSKADQHFLSEAIQGDLAEVSMGKLAQQKGQSDDVKQFGKMLEQDHGEHLQKAQQMAGQMGISAPAEPTAKAKAAHDRLDKLTGAKFDKTFAKDMVKDHKKDISKYKKEAKSKGQLAEFAAQTVPTLEKHLKAAELLTHSRQSRR